jgi:hypothetical protein
MLTPDHPNAEFLRTLYRMGASESDAPSVADLTPEQRAEMIKATTANYSPDWVIHTCGSRDATTGDLAFGLAKAGKRMELSGGTFRMETDWAIADDTFGAIHGHCTATRGDRQLDCHAIGMWRFAPDGTALEHWELISDPQHWDAFWAE